MFYFHEDEVKKKMIEDGTLCIDDAYLIFSSEPELPFSLTFYGSTGVVVLVC